MFISNVGLEVESTKRTIICNARPGQSWMDPDRPGVLIGSKWFFQTLELMTVEYALAA